MRQVPSATVAITHDSQWAMLLEKVRLMPLPRTLNDERVVLGIAQS